MWAEDACRNVVWNSEVASEQSEGFLDKVELRKDSGLYFSPFYNFLVLLPKV